MKLYVDTKPVLGEWEEVESNDMWISWVDYGRYHIIRAGQVYGLLLKGITTDDLGYFDTIEAAKAAAQADYERRTAERFKPITLPEPIAPYYGLYKTDYIKGQHAMYEMIITAIDRAKKENL